MALSPLNMTTMSAPIFFSAADVCALFKFFLTASRISRLTLFRFTASAMRFLGTENPTDKPFFAASFKTKADNSVPLNETPLVITVVND